MNTLEALGVQECLREVSANLGRESFEAIAAVAFEEANSREELDLTLAGWSEFAKSLSGGKEVAGVLEGYCLLSLGRVPEAIEALKAAKRHPWGSYYLAQALAQGGRVEEALDVAEDASEKHPDAGDLACLRVELLARVGKTEEAQKGVEKLKKSHAGTARHAYHVGLVQERAGEYAEAMASYREAIRLDGRNAGALFRLGYLLELHGTEADELNDEAVSAYEACVKIAPVHTEAVVNLGVLYEDRERYHDAIKCYETVLREYPNHARAKLYLKDAMASTRMFYDREMEKKADKQSQVLKIPVSDFELSVRSRNCLQKMNIQTLGDLIMKTEQELLSYKNFGETSLAEIKEMLGQKGLRLGEGLEGREGEVGAGRNPLEATVPAEVLNRSIDELSLSVRSRRCMERLEVRTVRDLINKTEVELMSAKNFGMTSLNEIKRQLAEMGLSLRS